MLVRLFPRTLYIQAANALGMSRYFIIDLDLAMTSSAGKLFCILVWYVGYEWVQNLSSYLNEKWATVPNHHQIGHTQSSL
jgi:hypothetical protein